VPERPANIMVVAADGSVLGNRGETGGEEVRLFELPRHLPQAVIAIEDRRFYSHFGVDPIGLARAATVNFTTGGVVQGGSTITQQLAKNLFLKPERTLRRKIQEVVLALWLEYNYSKDEILEMYLNRVYLGAGATGVEAAARVYFDKSAREVTLAEAATIAGLLQAPSRYAPTRNPEIAAARAQVVLGAMLDNGFITEEQAKAALFEPAEVKPATAGGSVGYVADWVAEVVPTLIGELRRDVVVETTVDPAIQSAAERALVEIIDSEGTERGVSEGAVVAMDPDGAVRALVGGRNYVSSQFNRAVKAKRQPGSAFKPFVYMAALEAGLSPDTLRTDAPTQFGNWAPSNYSGEFRGPMPLTDALSLSINTVAVRLTAEVGPHGSSRPRTAPASRRISATTCRSRWAHRRSRRWSWWRPTPPSPMAASASSPMWCAASAPPTATCSTNTPMKAAAA
jgi:penicillin-binding protein 1A